MICRQTGRLWYLRLTQRATCAHLLAGRSNTFRQDTRLPELELPRNAWLGAWLLALTLLLAGCHGEADTPYHGGGKPSHTGIPPYAPVTDQYSYLGIGPDNAQYMDSDRFRIYYGGQYLATESEQNIALALDHLENIYQLFVLEQGFRSPAQSILSNDSPYLKFNVYVTTEGPAGGKFHWHRGSGLGYLTIAQGSVTSNRLITDADLLAHEYGHALTYSEYAWVDKGILKTWWEPVADWFSQVYLQSDSYQTVMAEHGLPARIPVVGFTMTIAESHLPLVHEVNAYEAWPFFAYLTNNPDQYRQLGATTVQELLREDQGNNQTPLHLLERLVSPLTVQSLIGRYWAHMAYLDLGLPQPQTDYLELTETNGFQELAFDNWSRQDDGTYRVKPDRQPQYGGANITPLTVTEGTVFVVVNNLGNGKADSNFSATLSIFTPATRQARYVTLNNGVAQAEIEANEVVSLVVANTPDTLYRYTPGQAAYSDPSLIGLNYEVWLEGAAPAVHTEGVIFP